MQFNYKLLDISVYLFSLHTCQRRETRRKQTANAGVNLRELLVRDSRRYILSSYSFKTSFSPLLLMALQGYRRLSLQAKTLEHAFLFLYIILPERVH